MFDSGSSDPARRPAPADPDGPAGPLPGGLAAKVAAADAAGARLDRVAALAPGPLQVGLLAALDPETLDHAGRVELLQAWELAGRWVTAPVGRGGRGRRAGAHRPGVSDLLCKRLVRLRGTRWTL